MGENINIIRRVRGSELWYVLGSPKTPNVWKGL